MSIRAAIAALFSPPWPNDWRQRMANGNPGELANLQGYKTPEDVYAALMKLRTQYHQQCARGDNLTKRVAELELFQQQVWNDEDRTQECICGAQL